MKKQKQLDKLQAQQNPSKELKMSLDSFFYLYDEYFPDDTPDIEELDQQYWKNGREAFYIIQDLMLSVWRRDDIDPKIKESMLSGLYYHMSVYLPFSKNYAPIIEECELFTKDNIDMLLPFFRSVEGWTEERCTEEIKSLQRHHDNFKRFRESEGLPIETRIKNLFPHYQKNKKENLDDK